MNIQRRKKFVFVIALSMVTGSAIAADDGNNSDKKDALCQMYQWFVESGKPGFTEMPEFCPPVPPPVSKYIFVTSGVYDGNLGGVDGAHAICQTAADGVPERLPAGEYKAWIADSDSNSAPLYAHTHNTASYILPDGSTTVASNWDDLVDGTLNHKINMGEDGKFYYDAVMVWTGVRPDGSRDNPYYNCNNWTDNTNDPFIVGGAVGDHTYSNTYWTARFLVTNCSVKRRLYCVQQ